MKPNVLLIVADQFRGDCLVCVGYPDIKTPTYDRLAENGYATYASGKLHYIPYARPGEARTLHGFQHAALAESGRILKCYDPNGDLEGIEDYHDYLKQVGWGVYSRAHGLGNNDIHPGTSPLPQEHHVDAWVASQAIDYLDHHRAEHAEQPLFLNVGFPGNFRN